MISTTIKIQNIPYNYMSWPQNEKEIQFYTMVIEAKPPVISGFSPVQYLLFIPKETHRVQHYL